MKNSEKKLLNIFFYFFANQDLLQTISFIMRVIIDISYIITIRAETLKSNTLLLNQPFHSAKKK